MFTIHLNKLDFFSHHGLHDEEAISGTNYELNVWVQFNSGNSIKSIQETINYVDIYAEIQKNMKYPVALLETLAENIAMDIRSLDKRISAISVSINKMQPPIPHFTGNVGITFSKVF